MLCLVVVVPNTMLVLYTQSVCISAYARMHAYLQGLSGRYMHTITLHVVYITSCVLATDILEKRTSRRPDAMDSEVLRGLERAISWK